MWTFEDRDIHKEEMKPFRMKIKETDEILRDSLEILKTHLLEEENFNPCLDDDFLLRFLRNTKFTCWKALSRIKSYYRVRGLYPEIFGEYYPSSTRNAQNLKHVFASPYRTKNGVLIIVYKLGLLNPEIASFEEFLRLDLLIMEILARNPVTQICGCQIIIDLYGFTPQKMTEITPRRRLICGDIFESSFSLPIEGVQVVNSPGLFFVLYYNLLPVMTEEHKKTVKVHAVEDQWESLHAELPPEILPTEYGGQIDPSDMIDLSTLLEGKEEEFRNLQQHCMLDLSKVREEIVV